MNTAEQKRGSTDENDVYYQQNFYFAGNNTKNNRRASYAANPDRSPATPSDYYRYPTTVKPRPNMAYRDTREGYGLNKPSYNEQTKDITSYRHGIKRDDSSRNHLKSDYKDEVISTSSSVEQSKSSQDQSAIEHFKVVIMGDIFDGIKYKNLHQSKFAAASLYQSPEAIDLVIPDF